MTGLITRWLRGEGRRAWAADAQGVVLGIGMLFAAVGTAFASNGCKDTVSGTSCVEVGPYTLNCCRLASATKFHFGSCNCTQWRRPSDNFNFFTDGGLPSGPSCSQQNDTC